MSAGKILRLEDVNDFDALIPGDIVLVRNLGKKLRPDINEGPMTVIEEVEFNSSTNKVCLTRHYTSDRVFYARLRKEDVIIGKDGAVEFDFSKGFAYSILCDRDWPYYEACRVAVKKACLDNTA